MKYNIPQYHCQYCPKVTNNNGANFQVHKEILLKKENVHFPKLAKGSSGVCDKNSCASLKPKGLAKYTFLKSA